jgi:uncharacterized MAPEG superfamily protein
MPTILMTLFAAAVFPLVLAWVGGYFRLRQLGGIDNKHPRIQYAKLDGAGARAVGAQQNAWEALAVYTVAVFIAYASRLDLHTLTTPALVFIAARVLHPVFYIANMDKLRSLAFVVGFFTCVYIFYLAVVSAGHY